MCIRDSPNASGESRVDLKALADIAWRTGGEYFFAADQTGLNQIYQRIDALKPRSVETLSYRPRRSLAHLPLALAVVIGTIILGRLQLQLRARRAERESVT